MNKYSGHALLALCLCAAVTAHAVNGSGKLPAVDQPAPDFELTTFDFPMIKRFKGDYGSIKAVPLNFVVDRRGVLRYADAGAFTLDRMNEILGPLLAQPTG